MGYIGRDNRVVSFTKQSFTANGVLTSFTLDYGVGDSSSILVSVGGVVQQPDVAYTTSGTTLTFTAAPGIGTPVWVVYLGKELFSQKGRVYGNADSQIGTGNGTTTPLTLSHSVTNPQSIIVTLNGVAQVPTTDYTVSGTTLTFVAAPNSSKEIIVYFLELESSSTYITDGSITAAKLDSSGTLPAWNGSALTNLDAADLTGALPAIDGSALINQPGPVIKSASDPLPNANLALGTMHLNHTSGQMWVLTDATADLNTWTNVGTGTGDVLNNPPTNPNNTGSFQNINKNTSYQFTFSGATDPDAGDSVTHYHVDQISDGAVLSVSAASVAAGSAHTFTAANVGVDTNITFRVRAKDNHGKYSTGITVSMTVLNIVYTTATGGSITTSGDYKIHTFTSSSSFNVSQIGTDTNIDFLVVAGGGGGGSGHNAGGGGGGGGFRSSVGASGKNSSAESAVTGSVQNYTVTVGAAGAGGTTSGAGAGGNSVFSSITSIGGGTGGSGNRGANKWPYPDTSGNVNSSYWGPSEGGSGGGGASNSVVYSTFTDSGRGTYTSAMGQLPGLGTAGQGYKGAQGDQTNGQGNAGGGGGAGQAGQSGTNSPKKGGDGGDGMSNSITGSGVYYAGGGAGTTDTSGNPAAGGNGGGGDHDGHGDGGNGTTNLGGGGCGGGTSSGNGGNGGSGIVIVRYKYQN